MNWSRCCDSWLEIKCLFASDAALAIASEGPWVNPCSWTCTGAICPSAGATILSVHLRLHLCILCALQEFLEITWACCKLTNLNAVWGIPNAAVNVFARTNIPHAFSVGHCRVRI